MSKVTKSIRHFLMRILNKFLSILGVNLVRSNRYEVLSRNGLLALVNRWGNQNIPKDQTDFVFSNYQKSKSQLQQDLWALFEYTKKGKTNGKDGFFVEFGATDGVQLSNTFLLEKEYNWSGILCEPAKSYHEKLSENRSAKLDVRCVYSKSGELVEFHETENRELSGIKNFKHIGGWEEERKKFEVYEVETVTLHELLKFHGAPRSINYISIDTEGSEYEILKDFPFHEWDVHCFSVEHNFSENEKKLDFLLEKNGYSRVLKETSSWDSWYVKKNW